jgi:type II secretory ATPase GspE/PulE/Tfp pilus assembly ATPase PilB-like protein
MQKILFPTDYSAASNAALRYAVSLARQSDALLLVVHVVAPSLPPAGTAAPPDDHMAEEEAALLTLLTTVIAAHDKRVLHEFRSVHGDPAKEIVRLAEHEHVDLIVMSSAGRTGLRRMLMGSVAEAVVRLAPCPVISLKEPVEAKAARRLAKAAARGSRPTAANEPIEFEDPATVLAEAGGSSALTLLNFGVNARATDIHLYPVENAIDVRMRIDGRLEHFCRLPLDVGHPLVVQLKVLAEVDISDPFHPQEARVPLGDSFAGIEVRMTSVPVLGGESVALRLLKREHLLRPLDSLGLTVAARGRLQEMLRRGGGEGVVLVTGPAGSGKTTTAYSMVHTLDDGHRNIVTVEDPPEYCVPSYRQLTTNPRHQITMTSGLRTLLRMDPDVVLVGEIRDAETAEIAMRAASSGKFVITTLHTRDVASTITALRDLHIDNRSLGGNLTGIVSQRLVRRLCTACRQEVPLDAATAQAFTDEELEPPANVFKAVGCPQCRQSGYYERIGVFEVALPSREVREAIERGTAEEELRDLLRSCGTSSLRADALAKVYDGITTLDEVNSMIWGRLPGDA